MSRKITIEIKNKIATCLTLKPVVCDNKNYVCEFIFDEEWLEYSVKTARFVANHQSVDVVFEGNVCKMPPVSNAKVLWVGVYAGDLSTTTSAIVNCTPSILSGDDVPAPPGDDIYAQMLSLCDDAVKTAKSVEGRADNGEFNGADGKDAFSPTVEVKEIADGHRVVITDEKGTQNFDVMNGEDGKDGKDGKDADVSLVANALKGTASGEAIVISDASPIEHEMGVKVRSKNRITNDYSMSRGGKLEQDGNSFILTEVSGAVYFDFNLGDYRSFAGKTFAFSFFLDAIEAETNNRFRVTFHYGLASDSTKITISTKDFRRTDVGKKIEYTVTMPEMDEYTKPLTLRFYPYDANAGDFVKISEPQLEEGTEVTEFTPYVEDMSTVKVMSGTETYTPNADGTVNGVMSVDPVTTLTTDTEGVVIEAEYNKDTNKVIESLVNAIISLGGNV